MSKYNVDLMLEVKNIIESNPDAHDQRTWGMQASCGTTHCIAGWAVHLAGGEFVWVDSERGTKVAEIATLNGELHDVDGLAQDLLGISDDEVPNLFYNWSEMDALEELDALIEKGKNQ